VIAYPVAGKAKSLEICRAFVEGCGGVVMQKGAGLAGLTPGVPAFFYGVDASNQHLYDAAVKRATYGEAPFYYCDNSYFDATRQHYFRVTRNALQCVQFGKFSTGARYRALNLPPIQPWRESGEHIVVCPQSDHFMRSVVGWPGNWLNEVLATLKQTTQRSVRVRAWSPDKGALAATLEQDLRGAHALVTHSSAAAITALHQGIPVFCSSLCAAYPLGGGCDIDDPPMPLDPAREQLLHVLADNQWTLDEMRHGQCWADLQQQQEQSA
jgi:hypothetical protein